MPKCIDFVDRNDSTTVQMMKLFQDNVKKVTLFYEIVECIVHKFKFKSIL